MPTGWPCNTSRLVGMSCCRQRAPRFPCKRGCAWRRRCFSNAMALAPLAACDYADRDGKPTWYTEAVGAATPQTLGKLMLGAPSWGALL